MIAFPQKKYVPFGPIVSSHGYKINIFLLCVCLGRQCPVEQPILYHFAFCPLKRSLESYVAIFLVNDKAHMSFVIKVQANH
jgi:hypothetical protein